MGEGIRRGSKVCVGGIVGEGWNGKVNERPLANSFPCHRKHHLHNGGPWRLPWSVAPASRCPAVACMFVEMRASRELACNFFSLYVLTVSLKGFYCLFVLVRSFRNKTADLKKA